MSILLVSFDLRVSNALIMCACTHSCLTLACDIASDTNHSHLFVKLCLSGTVACANLLIAYLEVSSRDYISKLVICGSQFTNPTKNNKTKGKVCAKLYFK